MIDRKLKPASRAVHGGARPAASTTLPEVDPIYASAVFRFSDLDQVDDVWEGKSKGYVYSRMANPGIEALESSIDVLEQGAGTVVCSSGMAASAVAFEALLAKGSKVVSASVLYGATRTLFEAERRRRGIECAFVNILDFKEVESELKKGASILFCESISNPLMEVADIPGLAELAHRYGAAFVVDNTFATPMLLRPIELGADVVIHSLTKFMNGHDDIMGGSVSVSGDAPDSLRLIGQIREARTLFGPVISPFEAWLIMRGLRTLGVRMQRHSENAQALAAELAGSGLALKVYYPGLEAAADASSPAARLFHCGYGGMLSLEVAGGRQGASDFIKALKMAAFVPSLGSYATTVSHPATTSHRGYSNEQKEILGIADGLIRVSVGLEDRQDIICDFMDALKSI